MANKKIEKMLQGLNIPVVDDNPICAGSRV